ncbi:MAG: hypothetical protein WHU94_07010 [Thermogemmata sp.]|nr:zinc-ribbon domain-containing protein [Gemmataceae bacterium]
MPIVMTCESCGKQFRARDESAGKRVKCPYCATPMEVPLSGGGGAGNVPTGGGLASGTPLPSGAEAGSPWAGLPSSRESVSETTPSSSVKPGDWGGAVAPAPPGPVAGGGPVGGGAFASAPGVPSRASISRESGTAPLRAGSGLTASDFADPPRAGIAPPPPPAASPVRSQKHRPGYGRWRKTQAGLTAVLVGLFWLIIPGLVELGKQAYVRAGNVLPEGTGWITIPGYINDSTPGAIEMSKKKQLDILLYGLPVLLGCLFLGFGRLTCGAVPGEVGARGMFALSGLFALLGGTALLAAGGAYVLLLEQEARQFLTAALLFGGLAEVWSLIALSTVSAHLGQGRTARAAGLLVLIAGLWIAWVLFGQSYYAQTWRPQLAARPELPLWEQIAFALAYVLTVAVYWRAVSTARRAVRQQAASLEA